MGRAGYCNRIAAPPVHRCDVEVRRPLVLAQEGTAEYQMLVPARAPSALAQTLQAEVAPVDLHFAPECSGTGLRPIWRNCQRDTRPGLHLVLYKQCEEIRLLRSLGREKLHLLRRLSP
eukprot:9755471-Prorocentrum_lima.AAC.1